jgi:hypothetical protein
LHRIFVEFTNGDPRQNAFDLSPLHLRVIGPLNANKQLGYRKAADGARILVALEARKKFGYLCVTNLVARPHQVD